MLIDRYSTHASDPSGHALFRATTIADRQAHGRVQYARQPFDAEREKSFQRARHRCACPPVFPHLVTRNSGSCPIESCPPMTNSSVHFHAVTTIGPFLNHNTTLTSFCKLDRWSANLGSLLVCCVVGRQGIARSKPTWADTKTPSHPLPVSS
jgi:hypothetical protein